MKRFLAIAGVLALTGLALSQTPSFRVDVKMVRLLVTVKDDKDQLVGSLAKDDFRVIDSGVPQQIVSFEHHTEQPLSVALLLDTSASTNKDLKFEIDSCVRFLQALSREGNPHDALKFYTFNQDVSERTGWTRNPDTILRVLPSLRGSAGTSIYDAIFFSTEPLATREGRHVIVIVSDGNDTYSSYTYQEALKAAHRADAIIYSLVVTPITNDAGRSLGGEHALITLSESTGGKVFYPSVGPALTAAFDEVLRDLRTQYLITYYPKNLPESKNKFRTIQLQLAKPGLRASTRGGYYED